MEILMGIRYIGNSGRTNALDDWYIPIHPYLDEELSTTTTTTRDATTKLELLLFRRNCTQIKQSDSMKANK